MKRRLFKIALFLLLGMIVNVSVAWGIVLWTPQQPIGPGMALIPSQTDWPLEVPYDWPAPTRQNIGRTWGLSSLQWLTIVEQYNSLTSPTGAIMGWGISIFQSGWPCRSLEATVAQEIRQDVTLDRTFRPSIQLTGVLEAIRIEKARYRALPLAPIWPGFVINTILYAAILWLLILGPFAARRMIRRKRGRCIKCGYDLSGGSSVGCPECGWGREAEA